MLKLPLILLIIAVSHTVSLDCSTYPCRRCEDACQMVQDDPGCKGATCNQHPECIPQDSPSCNQVRCASGTECRLIPVFCKKCPCWPRPQCL